MDDDKYVYILAITIIVIFFVLILLFIFNMQVTYWHDNFGTLTYIGDVLIQNGNLTINSLNDNTSSFVCINENGTLYRAINNSC